MAIALTALARVNGEVRCTRVDGLLRADIDTCPAVDTGVDDRKSHVRLALGQAEILKWLDWGNSFPLAIMPW